MQAINHLFGYLLGWIMHLLYAVVKNYGVAIILFTLVTKIIVIPLSIKQQKSTAQMASFQPKLAVLQKKYGNNKEKMQEEQMKLYAQEGVNPMGSCMPMLLTFGMLFGIIDVVYRPITHIMTKSAEVVNQAATIAQGIFRDLSLPISGGEAALANFAKGYQVQLQIMQAFAKQPEAFQVLGQDFMEKATQFNNNFYFFGLDLGQNPAMVWPSILIPILAVGTQLISSVYSQWHQKRTNPNAPKMGAMNVMLYAMPFLSGWFALGLPAGVGLYWIAQSVFGVIQQYVLNKIYTPAYVAQLVEKERHKKKKKGPSRLQKALQLQEDMKKANMSPDGKAAREAILEKMKNNQPINAAEAAILKSAREADEVDEADESQSETDQNNVEETTERKLSSKETKELNRRVVAEARRRMAEKYGEVYDENEEDD